MEHTYGRSNEQGKDECPLCPGPHGGAGPCDQRHYSQRRLRFVRAHLEVFRTAYFNPNPSSADHELERLRREWATLPPRHDCTCVRLNERTGVLEYHCLECRRLNEQRPRGVDVGISIGRTAMLNAPVPDVEMMDLADAVSNEAISVRAVSRWLNGREGW